jgi:hypothetical protein
MWRIIMSKLIALIASGLLLATTSAANADQRCGCCGQIVASAPATTQVPATAEAPTVRRSYSYEPGAAVAPTYPTYRYVRPTTPRYLLPKTDARRFST